MEFSVKILGSSAALPAYNRHPTAQVVNHNENLYLIDCGEGTQMRLNQYQVKKSKIKHIFISHLHGDHYFGLMGLITSFQLLQRTEALHLYCPAKLKDIIEIQLNPIGDATGFELVYHFTEADGNHLLFENDYLEVHSFPLDHRIHCNGFLFKEKPKERKMLKEKISEYGIHFSFIPGIKKGDDFTLEDGRIIPNLELTADPPPPRSFAFCSDTAFNPGIADFLKGTDLIYHEATFTSESEERATKTFHSTAAQAAQMAQLTGAKKLLLGHFSAKYHDLKPHQLEAQAIFQESYLALEGECFLV